VTEERTRERAPTGYGGASIAFIAVYGAINGALALVPIFPYFGGGGFVPLSVVFTAIGPFILGPIGGVIAAIIGGIIGMFVSPAMFPLGLLDVVLTGILPAVFTALFVNTNKTIGWILSIVALILTGVAFIIFPYVWPTAFIIFPYVWPTIPGETADVVFFATTVLFWLPWLILMFLPIGRKWIPEWCRGDDPKKQYLGVFLVVLMGFMTFYYWWAAPYWYVFTYPIALATTTNIGYTWWWPVLAIVTAIIAIPVVEALKRSGLPRIPDAIW
jgi:hypothetical protein